MPYARIWKSLEQEDTSILLVRPKPLEFANTTIKSDVHRFLYSIMASPFANAATLDQEGSTTTYIEQENSYKTGLESLLRHKELEQSTDRVQWGRFITTNIEQEDSYKTSSYYSQRREILDRFDFLAQRKDNWDGYDSKKPSKTILAHAKMLIEGMLDTIISGGHPWFTPFISSDEDGFITVAWHIGELELHIEIEENEAEYTKISGTNHDMKMEIDFLNPDNFLILWEWLLDAHK